MLPVSVVIPAYNRERLLGEALKSVAAQTVQPAEVIVIDDGSTDRTLEIARLHGARVFQQSNRGPSAARNVGIVAATSPWIAFLDSDDIWLPNKLELQWAASQLFPSAGLVLCDYSLVDESHVVAESYLTMKNVYPVLERHGDESMMLPQDHEAFCCAFLRNNFMTPSAFMAKQSLLVQAGLFDESLRYCEDYELQLRLLALTTVAVVCRPLVRYRFHDANASAGVASLDMGMVAVTDRVMADPTKYVSYAFEYLRQRQPTHLRIAGVKLMRGGELTEARVFLARSMRIAPAFRTAVALIASWALTAAGPSFVDTLRAFWRMFARRGTTRT
jgi:GT2 family glycosyltransferase